MTAAPISTVVVAGGGVTAWSAAAALRKRIPSLDVTIVEAPVPDNALADRMIGTLPSIQGFHGDIGLTDRDTIVGAASGLRLGSLFEAWAADKPPYVHAYDQYGTGVEGVPFRQLWLREWRRGWAPPFDHFSRAAQLAREGGAPAGPIAGLQPALQLTLARYGEMMRAYALHLGVREGCGAIVDVELNGANGTIDGVRLTTGDCLSADLFVDCTGPAAILRSRMDSDFIDWSRWLACDRLIVGEGRAVSEAQAMDRITASEHGWHWLASSPERSSMGFVYSSAHLEDDNAAAEVEGGIGEIGMPISMRQGRWHNPWARNCVAIGDAAVAVEPLEWTNLHLAHSQIDRMVAMMPASDCGALELAEFNRQCAAEADRVRDFLCLHYVCSRRAEPFWVDASSITPPESLAHTLAQFKERGRFPFYEEETFSRDSWVAVMLGQGFEPERVDPIVDLLSPAEAARAITALAQPNHPAAPAAQPAVPQLNPRGIR